MNEEDWSWISAILAGDHAAYSNLVRKYQGMVYAVCIKVTGSPIVAEDLAQEVFIKAFRSLPSFRGDSSFSTWLYQISMHKCLDWKRSRQRQMVRESDAPIEGLVLPDTGMTPEQAVVERESAKTLVRMVAELQEPYRSITQWYYFDNHSYQDIAERTGLPLKTIESQLYRARKMMRERREELL